MRDSLFIGRFQPLHKGHIKLIQMVLDEGKPVSVALMDTVLDDNNPYTIEERKKMFFDAFGDKVTIGVIPPVAEVCWGRNVGWRPRRIYLDAQTEAITATNIRNETIPQVAPHVFHDADFVESFERVAQEVHKISVSQGLWEDGSNRDIWKVIAWAHSELSEALECHRNGNPPDKNITDMSGLEVQLSDVLGVLLDMQAGFGLKIAEALQKKMEFNKGRGYHHGGKKC